jgi:hypothetical protein
MDCEYALLRVYEYLDGELTVWRRQAITRHLDECPPCAEGFTFEIELRRVAEPVVHQLNMIIATRGASRVTSFFAPYACDACGREDSLLIDAIVYAQGLHRLEPPEVACTECGVLMEFNDFPERYFSFLSV